MKKTIEIEDDEILIAIKRPEDYEDVIDELTAEDAMRNSEFEWRLIQGGEK